MKTYTELFRQLKEADDSWECVGPQPVSRVDDVERKFKIKLPVSFRQFLVQLGGIEFCDAHYTSINDDYLDEDSGFMSNTKMIQSQCSMPDGLLALEYDHDSNSIGFLNLTEMTGGECPVVWYNPFTGDRQGRHAESFDQFFRELVSEWTA